MTGVMLSRWMQASDRNLQEPARIHMQEQSLHGTCSSLPQATYPLSWAPARPFTELQIRASHFKTCGELVRGEGRSVKCQKGGFNLSWLCDAWLSNNVTSTWEHHRSHTLPEELSSALRRKVLYQNKFNSDTFMRPLRVVLHLWFTGRHPGKPLKNCFQNQGDEWDPAEVFSETLLFRFGPAQKKGERLSQRKAILKN